MNVSDLIHQIETEEYPTGMSITLLDGELMEGYFRDENGEFCQIRRITSNDIG